MTTALSAVARYVDRRQRFFYPAPAVAVLFLIIVLPIAFNLYLMFTKWTIGLGEPRFIGWDNFVEIFGDERVWNGVKVMIYFSGASLALELFFGLMIALYFNRAFKGSEAVQAIYIIPFAATPVAVALIWRIMLNPEIGVINYLLTSIGLPPGLWVASPNSVVATLVMVDVWKWTPMITLIVLAGLAGVPDDPIEAARIDGANEWQVIRMVTIPMVMPVILTALILRLIDALKTFDIIYAMTGGGPGYASETLNILGFKYSFEYFRMGQSAVILVALFLVVFGCSLLIMRLRNASES